MVYRHTLHPRLLLGFAIVHIGCSSGDGDQADIQSIDVAVSDELIVSWDGGAIGAITVESCEGDQVADSCPEPTGDCTGPIQWAYDAAPSVENSVVSPIEYGIALGEVPASSKDDLVAGAPYSVRVDRYSACEPAREGCVQVVASGCAIFRP